MNLWGWLLLACLVAFLTKLAGYLLPKSWLDRPFVPPLAAALTVGLLSSLVVVNTLATGQRLLGLGAAALALKLRWPYIVVVLLGGLATALGRLAGLP
jgi:hypothetical protein